MFDSGILFSYLFLRKVFAGVAQTMRETFFTVANTPTAGFQTITDERNAQPNPFEKARDKKESYSSCYLTNELVLPAHSMLGKVHT